MNSELAYVVMDLETDGLSIEEGAILEVAAVGLDAQLQELFRYSTPITQDNLDWTGTMPEVVYEMHRDSSLIADVVLLSSALEYPLLYETDDRGLFIHPYIETADDLLAKAIRFESGEGDVRLAGSGVSHFDSRWIEAHMPKTAALFSRGTIDAGVMRRWYKAVVGDDLCDADSKKTHRALDDVNCHLAELMEFAALFVRDAMLRDYAFATTEQEISQ